jgi:hypothetical protein
MNATRKTANRSEALLLRCLPIVHIAESAVVAVFLDKNDE